MADPANCHAHLANCDKDLERVRKCFRHIETLAFSDNYYRLVSGLPPAPYPECQPSQAALKQNTLEYLTSLANLEVGSVFRVMEQPEMYADSVDESNPPTPTAPKTTGSQHGTPGLQAQSSKTIDRSNSKKIGLGDPIYSAEGKQSSCRIQAHPQATFHEQKSTITPGHPLSRCGITGLTKHTRKVCSLANPHEDCGSISCTTSCNNTPYVQMYTTTPPMFKCRLHQLVLHPLHRSGQMFQSLLL